MFRKFLHAFGIHYWPKWSDPKPVDTDTGFAKAIAGGAVDYVQFRVCPICNLYQATSWICLPEPVVETNYWISVHHGVGHTEDE